MNFICVPDFTKLIQNGDPTLINHEHISYFTKSNLKYYLKNTKYLMRKNKILNKIMKTLMKVIRLR